MENPDPATAFIEHLRLHGEPTDLMRLRRLLNRAEYLATTPLVEQYLDSAGCKDPWERQAHALVAKLWAVMSLERKTDQAGKATPPKQAGKRRSLGHTVAELYLARDRGLHIEQNFLDLLEAEAKQVGHQLNLLMATLTYEPGIPIHWPELLADLLVWNHQDRPTQKKWAREFNSLLRESELHPQEPTTDRQDENKYKPASAQTSLTSVQTSFWSRWSFLLGLMWGIILVLAIIAIDAILDANAG
jgi:CRISPR system Cascade subunit CasB